MTITAQVDGVGNLEFPDGTDPAIIQATVKRIVAQGNKLPGGDVSGSDAQSRMAQLNANWSKNNPVNQFGNVMRGGVDVIGGGAQMLSRGANALGLVPESNPGGFIAGPKDVEAQNNQARSNIDQWFGPQEGMFGAGVRAGSGGLLAMPFGPTRFLQAPSILSRSAGAGFAGASAAAMQEIPNAGDNADFAKKKLMQAGVGFAGGALAQPIAEKVVGSVVGMLNTAADKGSSVVRNLTGANSVDQIVTMTRQALAKSGISYDALDENVKQGLLNDVQGALKSYSGINPDAVARQAAFRQEGFDPLRHWITRDPSEFTAIENLSHVPGVGKDLMATKAALDQHVLDRLNGLRGAQPGVQDAGTQALSDLGGFLTQQRGKTNVLYRTFQEVAPNATGNPQRFANDVFGGLEGKMAGAALPTSLREIVNKVSSGEIPLTPSMLYQLQKMAKPGADGTTNFALAHLRGAIDRELGNISTDVGANTNAADVLKMARASHAQTQGQLEASPILQKADAGTLAPENFVDSLLTNKTSLNELASTWSKLGDDAKAAIRAQTFANLKQLAYNNASDSAGKAAAQATFVNYVNEPINATRLKLILGGDGYAEVKRLGTLLESAKMQPAGSAVNNSKSGGALVGAALKVSGDMKDLGLWGGTPLLNMAQRSAADNARSVPAAALGRQSLVINPMTEELLKRRSGGFGSLLGGAGANPIFNGLLGQPTQ